MLTAHSCAHIYRLTFILMPKLKIALIDDDQARAEYIKTSLIQHDFDVVACFTLDHLNIFKLEHLQADVILLDMDSPTS